MRHGYLDQLSRRDSPLHRLTGRVKLVAAILVVGVAVAVRLPWLHGAIAALLVVTAWISRLPARYLLLRLLLFEPVMLGVAVLSLFRPDGWAEFGALLL